MTKFQLLDSINSNRTAFFTITLGLTLIATRETHPIIQKAEANYGRFNIKFDQFCKTDSKQFAMSLFETTKVAYHALITETYELIKNYCKETGRLDEFRGTDWQPIARILRNSFNHNLKIEVSKMKAGEFPIKWNNKAKTPREIVIEKHMQDWDILIPNDPNHPTGKFIQFTYEDAITLANEMKNFAERELK